MTPRPARLVGVIVALAVVAAGCVEGFTGNEQRSDADAAVAAPAVVRAEAAPVVASLGARVLRQLATTELDNLVIAPAALTAQLSMVAAGSGTATAEVLDGLLGGTGLGTTTEGRTTLGGAVTAPASGNGPQRSVVRQGSTSVTTAIALWVQRGPAIAEGFLDELAVAHGTGVRQLDFRSDPEGARDAVNLWTAGATDDAIGALAPGGSVTSATRLLSTGAVVVAAPWLVPFDPSATSPAPFTTASGDVVEVPTMSVRAGTGLRWGSGPGWEAVGLPYLGRRLMLVVAMADPDAPPLLERLDGQFVTDIIGSLGPRPLTVRLPQTRLDDEVALAPVLSGLGAEIVFDTDLADLTPAAPTERLALTDVLQAIRLGIDEEGSDGRAASVERPRAPAAQATLEVSVNRPFLAMVVDVPTRIPIVMAQVVDPS